MATHQIQNPSFKESILDALPDPMIWVSPVILDDGTVHDFKVGYANQAAIEGIQHPKGNLEGLYILGDGVPSKESAPGNFQHFWDVYLSGEVKEYTFTAHHSNRVYETMRRPHEGGVLSITRDRGAQREAERKEEVTRRTLQSIFDSSPNGIAVFTSVRNAKGDIIDFAPLSHNQTRNELFGLSPEDVASMGMKQLLRLLGSEHVFNDYVEVVEKGTTIERSQFLEAYNRWVSISVVKLDDGILAMISDITELKYSHEHLQQQSDYLNSILNASLSAIFSCEALRDNQGKIIDLRYTQINEMYKEMVGKSEKEVIGKTMLEIFPTAKTVGAFDTHCAVIETGVPARFDLRYQGEGLDAWYDISSVKVGDDGVVVTFADVMEQKTAAQQLEQQKNLLDNILKNSPSGITVYRAIREDQGKVTDFQCILANEAAEKFTQLSNEERFSKSVLQISPELKDSPLFQMALKAIENNQAFQTQYYREPIQKWLELSVVKMDDNHLINVFSDITSTKEVQLQLENAANTLKTVFNAAQTGMFSFAPEYNEGELVDFRFVMVNATLASYVGEQPDVLEGALGSKWFPGYLTNGVFDMYRQTFESGETLRRETHYDVDGIDIYLDLQSVKVEDHVLVTFTDYTPLRKSQIELEQTIQALERSNAHLEDFAHAASHDMKEPIRKIRTFMDRLKNNLGDRMTPSDQNWIERIDSSAHRLQNLVDDLLEFSQVSEQIKSFEDIDLNQSVRLVLEDLELAIEEKKAQIDIKQLPTVKGDQRQLQQLFYNLMSNALKYSKKDTPPVVTISSKVVKGSNVMSHLPPHNLDKSFYLIAVRDNGIGFEKEYSEKIFDMFERLHGKAEYAGTGIGLSIVRKVVENHKGYIWSESILGKGATFNMLFPTSLDESL